MLDKGVWLFAMVKLLLGGLIFYVFYTLNFERRTAPEAADRARDAGRRHGAGLRDVGGLTLSV